ncbi:DUF1800 domain-containing protein [Wenyingzhuangia sp. IMCC45533]
MKSNHIIHLYNRVGFGILPREVKHLEKNALDTNVNLFFKKAAGYTPLSVNIKSLILLKKQEKSPELKRALLKENRKLILKLNQNWYKNLYHSEATLHEKMKLFWTNHFVCASNSIEQTLDYIKVIEKNALGNFKTFVLEISKNPMMIRYLNNQQNKKKHPNENYARELMELFTLGVGNYTEIDIKESARAFTGWGANDAGFVFRKKHHDFGSKTFMGKTGNFNGEDIIDILLEKPECAMFISQKIYKEFVNLNVNKEHVLKMAKVFRKNYSIQELMEYTLKADWFYDEKNIGVKIKSPAELLASIHKVIPFEFKKINFFSYLQSNLGQKLLHPPNVAGWPGNKQWIDANTIMIRLKLASSIAQQKEIEYERESTFEDDFETINKRKNNRSQVVFTNVDWSSFDKNIEGEKHTDLQHCLIGYKIDSHTQSIINSLNNNSTKDFCIALMSLPEFQMC